MGKAVEGKIFNSYFWKVKYCLRLFNMNKYMTQIYSQKQNNKKYFVKLS